MSFCFHLALFLPLIRGSGTVYVVKYELVIVSFSLSQYVYIIPQIYPNVNRVSNFILFFSIPVSYMQHHNILNITGSGADVKSLSYKIWEDSEKNL